MFRFLMDLGTRMKYNLIIDEFQEFYYMNEEIYSLMQDTVCDICYGFYYVDKTRYFC